MHATSKKQTHLCCSLCFEFFKGVAALILTLLWLKLRFESVSIHKCLSVVLVAG